MKMRVLTTGLMLMLAGAAWAQNEPAKPTPKPSKETQPAKDDKKNEDPKPLKVGDKAPPLTIEKWVKGEPVTGFEKGKVYVVEFWATWCGPCVKMFPHLSELQKEYKDKGVTVIGTNIWERKYDDDTFNNVKEFVEKQGDRMSYRVAFDGSSKAMDKAYMKAAGRNGIPSAFIVNQDGVVAWVGHPVQMDEPLKQIVAGKYDMKAAADENKKEMDAAAVMSQAQRAFQLQQSGKHEEAVKVIDSILGKNKALDGRLTAMKFESLLKGGKDADAYALANDVLKADKFDAMTLNNMAWQIVDPDAKVAKPDLDVALKLSSKSVEKEANWAYQDTLARVYFLKGDLNKALDMQKKAVESVKKESDLPPGAVEEIEARLKEYEKAAKEKK